jgi:hypothetical protein
MTAKTRICAKCNRRRAVSQFYANPRGKDGLDGTCKDCKRAYSRDRWANHRAERQVINARYFAKKKAEAAPATCYDCGEPVETVGPLGYWQAGREVTLRVCYPCVRKRQGLPAEKEVLS